MSGVLNTFSHCGLTVKELRDEISRLLNHSLTPIEEENNEWLNLPLQIYLAKLSKGEFDKVPEGLGELEILKSIAKLEEKLND